MAIAAIGNEGEEERLSGVTDLARIDYQFCDCKILLGSSEWSVQDGGDGGYSVSHRTDSSVFRVQRSELVQSLSGVPGFFMKIE